MIKKFGQDVSKTWGERARHKHNQIFMRFGYSYEAL